MKRENIDDLDLNGLVGDWAFINDNSKHPYIAIRVGPDSFKETVIIPIHRNGESSAIGNGQNAWEWDGNEDAPTISPSIMVWGNGRSNPATWHGFLRAGKLELA